MSKKSEFGKGLVYCLGLFATHFNNNQMNNISFINTLLKHEGKERELILGGKPPSKLDYGKDMEYAVFWYKQIVPIYGNTERALSSQLTTWANGATDHLYELEVPKKWEGTLIAWKVNKLRALGLEMGHGFTDKVYTMSDLQDLKKLTGAILFLIDKKIGLEPRKASWGEI